MGRQQREGIVEQGLAGELITAAPVGQQLKEQGHSYASPHHGQDQHIDVLVAQLPVRPIQQERAWPRIWQQPQHQTSCVLLVQRVAVKEAFHPPHRRFDLGPAGEALGKFGMPDILGLQHGTQQQ
ncbi:hypothetical protein GCM10022625_27000 [Deinococcus aetherius]